MSLALLPPNLDLSNAPQPVPDKGQAPIFTLKANSCLDAFGGPPHTVWSSEAFLQGLLLSGLMRQQESEGRAFSVVAAPLWNSVPGVAVNVSSMRSHGHGTSLLPGFLCVNLGTDVMQKVTV